jgi:hypothetical protein
MKKIKRFLQAFFFTYPEGRKVGRKGTFAAVSDAVKVWCLSVMLGFAFGATPVLAQNGQQGPDANELAQRLAMELPTYWEVASVTITAEVNDGDAIQPRYRQRFHAVVSPRTDLFLPVGEPADQALPIPLFRVRPTFSAKAERTVYGTTRAELAAGTWRIAIALESTVTEMGQPMDLFPLGTIVAGSEEETAAIAAARENILRSAGADVTEKLAEMQQLLQLESTQFRARQREELEALQRQQAEELRRTREEHTSSLEAMKVMFERQRAAGVAELEALQRQSAEEMRRTQQEHASSLEALKGSFERQREAGMTELETVQRQQAEELRRTREEHASGLEAMQVTFERQRTAGAAELDAFQRQQAEELRRTREEHASSLDAMTAAYERRREAIVHEFEQEVAVLRSEIQAAMRLALLENDLAQKRGERAEARARARTADANRLAQDMDALAKSLADGNPTARMATLLSAINGEDELLKHHAIAIALETEDSEIRRTAVAEALAVADPNVRGKGMKVALSSENPAIRFLAVRDLLAERTSLTLRTDEGISLVLGGLKLDRATGGLSGSFSGSGTFGSCGGRDSSFTGSLSISGIEVANNTCSVDLKVEADGNVVGTAVAPAPGRRGTFAVTAKLP